MRILSSTIKYWDQSMNRENVPAAFAELSAVCTAVSGASKAREAAKKMHF